jgi:hypothetical protein
MSCLAFRRTRWKANMAYSPANPQPQALGPLTAAIQHVARLIEERKFVASLDEETLTAGLFGGLASAVALFVRCYGSGIEGETRECSWGMFKKSRPPVSSREVGEKLERVEHEARSGADFALVLWQGPDDALVALFQAKKGGCKKSAAGVSLNIHRSANKATGETQFVVFASMCHMMITRTSAPPAISDIDSAIAEFKRLSRAERKRRVDNLTWGHYLVYEQGVPVCVPISAIDSQAIEEEVKGKAAEPIPRKDWIGLQTFSALLQTGVQGQEGGWLKMTRPQIEGLLPHLIGLMDVYETSEGGGSGLTPSDPSKVSTSIKAPASTRAQAYKLSRVISGETTPAPGSRPGSGNKPSRP